MKKKLFDGITCDYKKVTYQYCIIVNIPLIVVMLSYVSKLHYSKFALKMLILGSTVMIIDFRFLWLKCFERCTNELYLPI